MVITTPTNRYNRVKLGVDSGQMAIASMPVELNPNFSENDSYVAVVRARPHTRIFVRIDMDIRSRNRVARMVISTNRMYGTDASFLTGSEGVLVLADPCYFLTGDVDYDDAGNTTTSNDYSQACDATCNSRDETFGVFTMAGGRSGFCTSSGWGDGTYNADITLDTDGFFETIDVTFIDDEDEDENDDWDDDDDNNDDLTFED